MDTGKYVVKTQFALFFMWKFISLFLTNFDEYFLMDIDNLLVRDPSYLFDYMEE